MCFGYLYAVTKSEIYNINILKSGVYLIISYIQK